MSPGRVLAFDHGSVRIGVAVTDPLRLLASPLEVIDATDPMPAIRRLVDEYQPDLIVVGLPVPLSGKDGPSTTAARRFAEEVGAETGIPVELVDERFTSTQAERSMLSAGVRRRDRRAKVDKVAAALILQTYLDRTS